MLLLSNADINGLHRSDDLRLARLCDSYRYGHQLPVLRLRASLRWLWCQHQEETGAGGRQDQAHSADRRCTCAGWTHSVSNQPLRLLVSQSIKVIKTHIKRACISTDKQNNGYTSLNNR